LADAILVTVFAGLVLALSISTLHDIPRNAMIVDPLSPMLLLCCLDFLVVVSVVWVWSRRSGLAFNLAVATTVLLLGSSLLPLVA